MAIESLFDENLEWHPGLTEEQILDAKARGIYEPVGPEYEQFLSSVGIDKDNLESKGIVTEDKVFLESDDPVYNMDWHPDLTQEQILYALEKDIYEPVGQEYEQFLHELGLEPVEKKGGPIPPPPTPPYIPDPPPYIPGGKTGRTGGRSGGTGGGTGGVNPPIGGDIPVGTDDLDDNIPKRRVLHGDVEPILEDPKPKVPTGGDGNGFEDPNSEVIPVADEPNLEDPKKKKPTREEPPITNEDPTGIEPPGDNIEKEEEEETIHVVRVERRDRCHIPALLVAAALAFSIATGFYMEDIPLREPTPIVSTMTQTNYEIDEYLREMIVQDKVVDELVYRFLAEQNLKIGDKVDVGTNTPAYYYGNLTGNATTVSGEQAITGFCLYSPDNGNLRYEYSFYEDRALDGTPDRTSVQGLGPNVDVSLEEFLAQLDVANYDMNNLCFSLHMGKRGWVEANDLVKINGENVQLNVQELVEVAKKVATHKGTAPGDADFANIAPEGEEPVWVKLTDDETDELFPAGTVVEGKDGKQYIITSLERVTIENEQVVEGQEVESRLAWSITEVDLIPALLPLLAADGISVATAIKNKKNKENPNFFEFENDEDYLRFKDDFEKAREEYRSASKFGNLLKRIFIGEKYHISTDLTEEQVEEMYTTIRNSDNEDYTYNPNDQIRIMEGQVFAVHEDGTKTNITKTVSHIGKDNPEGTKGLLTDEIVETHGGGKKV